MTTDKAATPRTDVFKSERVGDDGEFSQLFWHAQHLETELTECTEQLAEANKQLVLVAAQMRYVMKSNELNFNNAANAEAEVARLNSLVQRCRPAVEYAMWTASNKGFHDAMKQYAALLTEIDKEIKA